MTMRAAINEVRLWLANWLLLLVGYLAPADHPEGRRLLDALYAWVTTETALRGRA